MAVNIARSLNASLDEGSTDGTYQKVRPDTTTDAFDATLGAKRHLSPNWGYGTGVEAPAMVRPDGRVASRAR